MMDAVSQALVNARQAVDYARATPDAERRRRALEVAGQALDYVERYGSTPTLKRHAAAMLELELEMAALD